MRYILKITDCITPSIKMSDGSMVCYVLIGNNMTLEEAVHGCDSLNATIATRYGFTFIFDEVSKKNNFAMKRSFNITV